MRTTLVAVALCAWAFLAGPALSAVPLAEKMPEGAILYVGWGGRSLTFDGSMLGQLLQEPGLKDILAGAHTAIGAAVGNDEKARQAVDCLWTMGGIAWQHPAALGLFDLAIPGAKGEGAPPQPQPLGAILIDLGKDRQAFAEQVNKLLNLAGESLKITQATAGSVTYQTFETPAGPCGVGFAGDVFFVCIGQKAPETVVDLIGGTGKTLAADPKFAAAIKEVSGESVQWAYYVDVARLLARVEEMIPAQGGPPGAPGAVTAPAGASEFRRIVSALGVGGVTTVAGAGNIVERGVHEKYRISTPAPHTGAMMLLAGEPLSPKALAGVPADADLVLAANLDPAKILAEVKRVAAAIDPKAGKEVENLLATASKELGADVEKDLAAHVGPQWTLISAPSLGGFITGTVLTVELKDQAKFAAGLDKVEAFFKKMLGQDQPADPERPRRRRFEIRAMKSGKLDVHYLAAPGIQMPVAPAWAIHEGRLYVAAFPQVVIAAATGTGEKPLAEDPAFLALRKPLAATPSALVYVNTPALARRLYGAPLLGWTFLSNISEREIGPAFRPEMLPPLSRVEKYLSTDIFTISSDAKGITFEAYGSGVGSTIMGGSPPVQILAASALLPALAQARRNAKEAVSRGNLRTIGMACAIYANAYNDRLPPDLGKLVEDGSVRWKVFYSPNSGRNVALDEKGKPVGPLDYVYLGGGVPPEKVDPRLILAYERPEINDNRGTNVLYMDYHVEWLPMARFQAELPASEKALAQARAPAEPKK